MYWKNGIHQLSGFVEIDGAITETFDIKVQPNPAAVIDPEALKVSGITPEILQSYQPMRDGYNQFVAIISKYIDRYNNRDKFHLVGYNNRGFDDPFLRAWFVQNGDPYFGSWFWADSIDVMVLASAHLLDERRSMPDFKLMTVARKMGIEVDESKLHDALYDIHLTRGIYLSIKKP